MSDDSDDDSLLLDQPVFGKSKKKRKDADSEYLERIVELQQKDAQQAFQIARLERQDDEKGAVKSVTEFREQQQQRNEKDAKESARGGPAAASSSSSFSLWTTRPTLYVTRPRLPQSRSQVLDLLDRLLGEQPPSNWQAELAKHLSQDTLEDALGRATFRRNLLESSPTLSPSTIQWLLLVVVCLPGIQTKQEETEEAATDNKAKANKNNQKSLSRSNSRMAQLATGAYCLLRETLEKQQQPLWTLEDLLQQLQHYFGMKMTVDSSSAPKDDSLETTADAADKDVPDADAAEDGEKYCGPIHHKELSVVRFLQLWECALRRGLVVASGPKVYEQALKSIVWLITAASDPLIENRQPVKFHLQSILHSLLGIAEASGDALIIPGQLLTMLVEQQEKMATTSQDESSVPNTCWVTWFAPGMILLATPRSVGRFVHSQSSELRLELCQSALASLPLMDDSDWGLAMRQVLERWSVGSSSEDDNDKMISTSRLGLANTFVALSRMRPLVTKGEDGPICLAALELAMGCMDLALADLHQHYKEQASNRHDDKLAAQQQQPFHSVPAFLKKVLEDLSSITTELIDKSKPWVLGQADFMRLNYYLLCFRQIPRLETPLTGKSTTPGAQRTLDQFFGGRGATAVK